MQEIRINSITATAKIVSVRFSISKNLEKYFKDLTFWVEYDENIDSVPQGVLIIPFLCNVLPIVWLTDAVLFVNELDKDFYESLDSIKSGYKRMHPKLNFKGRIEVSHVVKYSVFKRNSIGCFFSGGIDALCTLVEHYDECPELITIHGSSDFNLADRKGWEVQKERILSVSKELKLTANFISSNFYEFIDVWGELTKMVRKCGDNWWHGIQHGIGLIGHAAPLAYLKGYRSLYIASSWCVNYKYVCASDPIIDNLVRFIGVNIIHDGYNYQRQDKISIVANFVCNNGFHVPIQVCLHEEGGHNCGHCEKCIRTAIAFVAEGINPEMFDISNSLEVQVRNIEFLSYRHRWIPMMVIFYKAIQKRFIENADNICDCPYKDWMLSFDFDSIFSIQSRFKRFLYHFKNK